MTIRKRKPLAQNIVSGCHNCGANPHILINDLCPHCSSYLAVFDRHRPVFKGSQCREWLEFLEAIQVDLKGIARETRRDKDLNRFVTATYQANEHTIQALKDRIKDGRNF